MKRKRYDNIEDIQKTIIGTHKTISKQDMKKSFDALLTVQIAVSPWKDILNKIKDLFQKIGFVCLFKKNLVLL